MGKEITTKMSSHTAKEYWGGDDRGMCLQITASGPLRVHETAGEQIQEEGFIQLTMEEAAALCNDLIGFVKREAMRRQALLKAEIERAKIAEKTVFHEVASLPSNLMGEAELAVMMVSRFCPKTHNTSHETRQTKNKEITK